MCCVGELFLCAADLLALRNCAVGPRTFLGFRLICWSAALHACVRVCSAELTKKGFKYQPCSSHLFLSLLILLDVLAPQGKLEAFWGSVYAAKPVTRWEGRRVRLGSPEDRQSLLFMGCKRWSWSSGNGTSARTHARTRNLFVTGRVATGGLLSQSRRDRSTLRRRSSLGSCGRYLDSNIVPLVQCLLPEGGSP